MPVQTPAWTEFLSCPICYKVFDGKNLCPISLACSHTICRTCLSKLQQKKCPFDQNLINKSISELPINHALLQLVGVAIAPNCDNNVSVPQENINNYESARHCIEALALYLKPLSTSVVPGQVVNNGSTQVTAIGGSSVNSTGNSLNNCMLSRPMQRKLVTLVNCQLVEEEGRGRAMRAARSLGERTVTELILQHQNPQQLSSNLWAAVRARGCQFLGPAMQEEVLKLILLALEDGSALSRKVLVMFVVQRLETHYPQASKTAIGHVVQLLYRASCFVVTKREEESSLMQLKEECRTYDALRRDHDSQIVQIAMEAGLRIAPDQWSSLLYGDTTHKSHMQSIIDKLQTPQSFSQSVNELVIALQRTGDPCNLQRLRTHLEFLANIDPSPEAPPPSWENLEAVMKAVRSVVQGLVDFVKSNGHKKLENTTVHNSRYKTSMCRDFLQKNSCPRSSNCTFAHSQEELDKYRSRTKKTGKVCNTPPDYEDFPTSDGDSIQVSEKLKDDNFATGYGNQRSKPLPDVVTAKVLTSLAKSMSSLTFAQAKGLTSDKMTESSETGPRMSSIVVPGMAPLIPPPNTMQPPPVQVPRSPYPLDMYQGQRPPTQRTHGPGVPAGSRPVFGGGQNVMTGRPGFQSMPRYMTGPYRPQYNNQPQPQPQVQYTGGVPFRQPVDPGLTRMPFPQQQQQQPPIGFVNYNYPHNSSALNPYAEPFQGGGSRPLTPEDQIYPVVGNYPEGLNYQLGTMPPGQGQAKILNDLHHRRAEILNRLFNPADDLLTNSETPTYSSNVLPQSDADDMLRGDIHSKKSMFHSSLGLYQGSLQSSQSEEQDLFKMMTGQRSMIGTLSEQGCEGSPAGRHGSAQVDKKRGSSWQRDYNKSQLLTSSKQPTKEILGVEEYKVTNQNYSIASSDFSHQQEISSSSKWVMVQPANFGAHHTSEESCDMTGSAPHSTLGSSFSVQKWDKSQAYGNRDQVQNMTNSTGKTSGHNKSDVSYWRASNNSNRNRTFHTKNDREISESSNLKPDNIYAHQRHLIEHVSRNTSTISNPSDTPAALDTGCAVWSIDGVDDVVWNFTDTQAVSNQASEEEDLLKEEQINSTEFMLNWLHDIPDEPTPIEPMDQFIFPLSRALDRREDDAIIPFDSTPMVSRFGPISRSARTKYKNTEPVQVTANDVMKKVTPVTAVTPLDHPKPTAKAQPSYMSPVVETSNTANTARWRRPSELENCVQRELSRLEQQALKADTENEFLACELKAVELQISLQTEKTVPQPVAEAPIIKPDIHPAVEVVVPVPVAVPVKTDSPHNPPGIWSSFELLKAAYTRGQTMDDLRELLKHVPIGVDKPSGPLTQQEEQLLKDVFGGEIPSSANLQA
ncbi:roquin-2-like [Ylistrum balloti]|uniref:roquin-2-like n=1 Tax=Ylistrum balloti TaxID=509963 RepID=UPI00290596B8|nr:roquin-2-like [Ylistrum balloti]